MKPEKPNSTLPSVPDDREDTEEHPIVPPPEAIPILSKGNGSSDKQDEDPDDIFSRVASEVAAEEEISKQERENISGALGKTKILNGPEVLAQMFPMATDPRGREDETYTQ